MKDQTITLANWDMPPFNRWSFLNMSEIVPVAPVSCGDGPVREFMKNRRGATQPPPPGSSPAPQPPALLDKT